TATLLPSGLVLVTGGSDSNANISSTAELYDPQSGAWRANRTAQLGGTPLMMTRSRYGHTATLLPNGKVLIAGDATSEIFDPATETFTVADSLRAFQSLHRAVLLADGRVLITG